MAEVEQSNKNDQQQNSNPPAMEWLVAAIGLILVVGAVGFLIYKAVGEKDAPPNIVVSVDSIIPRGDKFLVNFRVKNSGATTAAALTIEGELKNGEQSIEVSTATLAYAPSNSERKGGLFFSENPQNFDLQIRATGFEEP